MRTHLYSIWIALAAGLSLPAGAAGGRPQDTRPAVSVALVVQEAGTCKARIGAHAPWQPITLGDEVFAGESVRLDRGASVVLAWHRGGPRFRLNAGCAVTITPTSLHRVSGPRPLRLPDRDRRVTYDAADMRPSRTGILASATRAVITDTSTRLKRPLGAIFDTRPRFTWACVPAVSSVRLSLYAAGQAQPLWTQEVEDGRTELTFPDGAALEAGKAYRWALDVPGAGDATTRTEALCWVPKPEVKAYLDGLRAQATSATAEKEDRLILLRALWDAGRFEEAVTAADDFCKSHPGDEGLHDLAARLRKSLDALATGRHNALKAGWPKEKDEG